MADISKLEARIKMLEARRERGESVPELDALYERMNEETSKAYKESSKGLSGDYTGEKSKAGESAIENMKQYGMKKGGMTASSRADGCAVRGKTKGRIV